MSTLPKCASFDIIASMEDNSNPIVEVKLAEDGMTASVVVTFPFMDQALAFGEVCRNLLQKMPLVANQTEI